MATRSALLAQGQMLAPGTYIVYRAPADATVIVKYLEFFNLSTLAGGVYWGWSLAGPVDSPVGRVSLPANDGRTLSPWHVLPPLGRVLMVTETTTNVAYWVSGTVLQPASSVAPQGKELREPGYNHPAAGPFAS